MSGAATFQIRARRQVARPFGRDERGVAAVEAALLLPVVLIMLAMLVIWSEGFAIQRKVTQASRTITDIVTQSSVINQSDLDLDLGVSSAVMTPYSGSSVTMVVSELQANAAGTVGTVIWSEPFQGTALTVGSTLALPSNVVAANGYVILGQASYLYTPLNLWQTISPMTISDQIYMAPRISQQITVNWGQ